MEHFENTVVQQFGKDLYLYYSRTFNQSLFCLHIYICILFTRSANTIIVEKHNIHTYNICIYKVLPTFLIVYFLHKSLNLYMCIFM